MKNWIILFFLAAASLQALPSMSQVPKIVTSDKAGWHKLGETTVSFESEKDEIYIMGKDRFKSLRILVKYQPVYIASLVVHYDNGITEDIAVNADMLSGTESKVFDLKNSNLEISKIAFSYKTASNAADEKAHVEVCGLK